MSIGSILNVSLNALSSYQLAIDVTGGNIANVNTPGYTRQRAVLTATGSVNARSEAAQISVKVADIERIFDTYTENQVAQQQQKAGYGDTRYSLLQKVETVFDETTGNKLNDAFNRFWEAWSDLALHPAGKVERDALLAAARTAAEMFNSYGDQIYDLKLGIDEGLKDSVAQINSLTSRIAALNKEISSLSARGGETNLLRDERGLVLKDLCRQVSCHWVEDANGAVNVYLPNGQAVVEGIGSRDLALVKNGQTGFQDLVLKENPQMVLNDFLAGGGKGVVGAYLDVRDGLLPDYEDKLNELAKTFMDAVNDVHTGAYDADGNLGERFFVLTDENSTAYARNITVNGAILSDPAKIAASATTARDGEKAAEIAALKDRLLMGGGSATLGSFYASLVGTIGRDAAAASRDAGYQNAVLTQLQNQRESVSGVSLDEEMMNLMKFQMAYTAAGKLCRVADDLLETLMKLVD